MVKTLTLCVIHTDTHILLGLKKRGFGVGRWNGFGGKIELGESVEDAARRELREECGLEARELEAVGVIRSAYATRADALEIHVFAVRGYSGSLSESDEVKPAWFKLTDIPYDQMWPDDRHWLPLVLGGKRFEGEFYFLDDDVLLHHSLTNDFTPAL